MSKPTVSTKKILFIPDTHIPYHHKLSWNLLLHVARSIEWDHVVILGDWLDLASMSSHARRRPVRVPTLIEELKIGDAEMQKLNACFLPSTKKYYIEGNHEERFGRFVANNMNLDGVDGIQEGLSLLSRGWKWVPYHEELKLGKLYISHDYDNAGENAHRQARLKVGGNVVIGHTHRMEYSVKSSVKGSHVAAMFGWLGDESAALEYKSRGSVRHEWARGFGCGLMTSNGDVHLEPCPIVNGKVKVLGSIYSLR